jgi:glucose dehydrogenase
VTGGDDRIRAIDAATGKEVWMMQLGAATRGIPSMYELNGRQYLLVTASGAGIGANSRPRDDQPHGLVAFALPAKK